MLSAQRAPVEGESITAAGGLGAPPQRAVTIPAPPEGGAAIREELEALRIDRDATSGGRATRWLLAGAIIAALAAGTAAVWLRFGTGGATTVSTRVVTERSGGEQRGTTVLNASGYVTARRRATVSAKITGRLTEVAVEEGMPVEEGQVVARLDDSQYRARLALAEAGHEAARTEQQEIEVRLELARLTLARTEKLEREGVTDEAALDQARAEMAALVARSLNQRERVRVAEREVALARTELDDTVVRAPFDGVVISKDAQPGEMVSPMSAGGGFTRTGICTIVDMGSLEIEVDVNESYISRVRPDQPIEAVLDAYPEWAIPGRVITTVPAADRQRATVLVRIAFDELDPRILPDMGVKVAFREEAGDDAASSRPRIVIPREAVRVEDGREIVFVLHGERVERRAIETVPGRGDEVEVTAGLATGEKIVVEAEGALEDGARVRTE
jgi:RND family efflux transporter MFP subunit